MMLLSASWQTYIVPAAATAVMLAAVAGYWFWGKDRRLKPVDLDRIPDQLSALEIGTAVDGIVQGENLGVQLFDWAQRGYLKIDLGGSGWQLKLGKVLERSERLYEKEAWDVLFDGGKREVILPAEDRTRMLRAARILQKGAEQVFESGEKRLMDGISSRIALVIWCIGALCLLVSGALAGWQMDLNAYGIAPMAIASAAPAILASWLSGWFQRFYQVRSRKRNYLVVAAILMADLVMVLLADSLLLAISPVEPWLLTPLVCAGVFCAMLAPFVGRRSNYGYCLLCETMGFRDALADETRYPGRLQGETEEQYCFRMLPYAQVLGVGEDFARRYADKNLTAPCWMAWEREDSLSAQDLLQWLVSIRDQLVDGKDDSMREEEI